MHHWSAASCCQQRVSPITGQCVSVCMAYVCLMDHHCQWPLVLLARCTSWCYDLALQCAWKSEKSTCNAVTVRYLCPPGRLHQRQVDAGLLQTLCSISHPPEESSALTHKLNSLWHAMLTVTCLYQPFLLNKTTANN